MNGKGGPQRPPSTDTSSLDEAKARVPALSDTERYLLGRERILGDRLNLSRRPEEAARELVELMGGRTIAYRWASALLKAAS